MTTVKLPMPAQVGVGIDAVTIGGTTVQSVHGDVRFDETGWSLDRFTFRAPGFTQVSLSGRLKETPQGVAFSWTGHGRSEPMSTCCWHGSRAAAIRRPAKPIQ